MLIPAGSSACYRVGGGRYEISGGRHQNLNVPPAVLGTGQFSLLLRNRTSKGHRARPDLGGTQRACGATVGIQHPTTSRYNVDVEGLNLYIHQLGKSLEVLLPVAESLNYTIALENLPPGVDGGRLSSRPEHFEKFIEAFKHPNLGFILDTGHALIAAGPAHADDFHAVMAPYMAAYHLADNAGDRDSHLAPGHGLVDWNTVFRRAAEIGFSGCMCIETPPFAAGANGTYTVEAWKQMVDDTDTLVAQALRS